MRKFNVTVALARVTTTLVRAIGLQASGHIRINHVEDDFLHGVEMGSGVITTA
eukprot:COSAG01_NODE_71985_length_254_cov_0.670968_1_plen_52_part_10